MGKREWEKMGRKEERKWKGKEMSKKKKWKRWDGKIGQCVHLGGRKKNGRRNEGVVVCVEKKMGRRVEKWREVGDAPTVSGVWGKKWKRMGNEGEYIKK